MKAASAILAMLLVSACLFPFGCNDEYGENINGIANGITETTGDSTDTESDEEVCDVETIKDDAYDIVSDSLGDFSYECDPANEWCDESALAMSNGNGWFCWILMMGCLVGCDYHHGGSSCEQLCFQGYNSCIGSAERAGQRNHS